MADAYSKIGWENSPSEKTPINMTNLNHMDEGIEKNRELISQLEEQIVELEESGIGGSGGQPIVVKTATVMTDTTAIYLYMGEGETVDSVVYEYGYIYTYDTDTAKWVNSGLYGRGKDGEKGADGYTPSITTEQTVTGISITVTDQNGTTTVNVENGTATDEQVSAWLDEHPEATSTIEDGSITPMKTDFIDYIFDVEIETTISNVGYNKYGSDFIDITNLDVLYARLDKFGVPNCFVCFYDSAQTALAAETHLSNEHRRVTVDLDGNYTSIYEIDLSEGKSLGGAYVKVAFQAISDISVGTVRFYDSLSAVNGEEPCIKFNDKYGDLNLKEVNISLSQTGAVKYTNPNLINPYVYDVTGYSDIPNDMSANKPYWYEYIDTSLNKDVYIRSYVSTTPSLVYGSFIVVCYDAEKNFLYTENTYTPTNLITVQMRNGHITMWDGVTDVAMLVQKITVPDEVKYIQLQGGAYTSNVPFFKYLMVSYSDIYDLSANPETYEFTVSDEFTRAVEQAKGENETNTMVMIGDSLTNWAGGDDLTDGFLKIVHDKTGLLTRNEGLAGAWWQLMDGETIDDVGTNGVGRVNAIIADNRKYDIYCFMLGTNSGSNTDTGETSADATTMSGAIRYCMEKLKAYDPTGKILVCLPPQRAEGNENQEKVNDVIKSIVESYGVKTLDIYHHSGIVPNTKIAGVNYLSDGLHLGENGYTMLGNLLASEIKYLFCL